MFLKIALTSQENTCAGDFFNKVAGLQAFQKETPTQV